jgi:hypothetical protein
MSPDNLLLRQSQKSHLSKHQKQNGMPHGKIHLDVVIQRFAAYTSKRATAAVFETRSSQPPTHNIHHVRRHRTVPATSLLPRGTKKHVLSSSFHQARATAYHATIPLGNSCAQTHPCLCPRAISPGSLTTRRTFTSPAQRVTTSLSLRDLAAPRPIRALRRDLGVIPPLQRVGRGSPHSALYRVNSTGTARPHTGDIWL